jgi:type IV pilus assembly protein PilM
MAQSFPPDVIVLDDEKLLHARLARGKKGPRIVAAKSYRLAANTFSPAVVSPQLTNESSLAEAVRRLRIETGRWDRASVLLPDSWFRINILDIAALPEGAKEAEEMVRWSLKRTMPLDPALLRVRFEVLTRTATSARVLALTAIDQTLVAIENVLNEGGIDVVLIEPIGVNIWNAIAMREPASARDRIFFYVREGEFTTAAFRGAQPLFIRTRNLNSNRSLEQEIKLSASYLRDTVRTESVEQCYISGTANGEISSIISQQFGAPVRKITLADMTDDAWPDNAGDYESELAAATGVFTS